MKKAAAILLVGLAPVAVRLALLPWMPVPAPRLHDEFSHLLLADTIAHGRAVNPVHPQWPHFESMHILVKPLYASPYPPAQGAVMALGQIATGIPWAGVVVSVGLMCGAIVWMLQGWVSPRWALLGALLVAARFGVTSYWMNSYYGGAVPAMAGALVLGAAGRMLRRRRWQDAAMLGVGLAILANSRPYEGLIFGMGVGALLVWRLRKNVLQRKIILPVAAVLGVTAVAMGAWFAQYTGNPLVMPYEFFRANFTEVPHLLFQNLRPTPVYYHHQTRDYYHKWEMLSYDAARANQPPRGLMDKLKVYTRFYAGPALGVALLAALWGLRRWRVRWLLAIGALLGAALAVEVWHAPHYAAPAMAVMVLLAIEGLRQLRQARWGRISAGAVCVASLAIPVWDGGFRVGDGREREDLLRRMAAYGNRHLLIVRYAPLHDSGDEWVYNGADIDGSPVVWAREMDAAGNRELVRYFAGREVWLVEPDVKPVRVTEYDPAAEVPRFGFVPLGSEGVAAVRSADEIRSRILAGNPPNDLECDEWNELFYRATGIAGPDPAEGCYNTAGEDDPVSFEKWFGWVQKFR